MMKVKSKLQSINNLKSGKKTKEPVNKIFKPPTHLYLHEKRKQYIEEKGCYKYLTHLYLHDNQIEKIENLSGALNLQELYLHHNRIKKIENLDCLIHLRRLYLNHNEISVIEGLDTLDSLEELHIEKQKLRESDSLCFDPRSIFGIRYSLRILNCSRNNITDISNLEPLFELRHLDLSENNLSNNIEDVCFTIQKFLLLETLNMYGNPISKVHRYRESLIASTRRMKLLDDKPVQEVTRTFIHRMKEELEKNKSSPSIDISHLAPEISKSYSDAVQKTVMRSIIQKRKKKIDTPEGGVVICRDIPKATLPNDLKPKKLKRKRAKLYYSKYTRTSSQKSVSILKTPQSEPFIQNLEFPRKMNVTQSSHK